MLLSFDRNMCRLFPIIATLALFARAQAADELPRPAPGNAMDLGLGLLPDFSAAAEQPVLPAPAESVARIEAALDRAKKSAASGERMFRAGIIAKVEAEKRALKVVRLAAELAVARLEAAKLELGKMRAEFDAGKLSKEQLDAAQSSADAASEAAAAATAARDRAEVTDAEINVTRQRQLLAAGIGSKSLVARAQSQLATLKSKTPPLPPASLTPRRRSAF